MENLQKKDSAVNARSMCTYFVGCLSLGNSTESQVQQSSMTRSLSLERGIPPQHFHDTKQLSFQFRDQDSSSSQSTGQSYPEVASVKDNNLHGGYTHRMLVGGYAKLASLTGTRDIVCPPSQVDYIKSSTHMPVHYAEPYLGSVGATAYGSQATIHHGHMMAMFPTRVPLPVDLKEDEPIYVNAKHYHAILRRRQYRARLEAQNKVIKVRKPYLHESRHLHALKRVRGSGGQFLNTKKLQESKSMSTSQGPNMSRSPQLHLSAKISKTDVHRWKLFKDAASATSCSDVTSASNSDEMFQQTDFRFSSYPCDHIGEAMPVHTGDGNLHHLSCLFR